MFFPGELKVRSISGSQISKAKDRIPKVHLHGSLEVSRESQDEVNQQMHIELKVSQVHSMYGIIYAGFTLRNKVFMYV